MSQSPLQKRRQDQISGAAEQQDAAAARVAAEPDNLAVDTNAEQGVKYGVYSHDLLNEVQSDTKPIIVTSDWDSAYEATRQHARHIVDKEVQWGASRDQLIENTLEIIDSSNVVRLRYDITPIQASDTGAGGDAVYKRRKLSASTVKSDNPPSYAVITQRKQIQYGLYVEWINENGSEPERQFMGGFTSREGADAAMKISAKAHLKRFRSSEFSNMSAQLSEDADKELLRRRYFYTAVDDPSEYAKPPVMRLTKSADVPQEHTVDETITDNKDAPEEPTHAQDNVAAPLATTQQQDQPTQQPSSPVSSATDQELYCTCRRPDDGKLMIGCDKEACEIGWYHSACVGVRTELKGKWFCDACKPAKKAAALKKKKMVASKAPKTAGVEKKKAATATGKKGKGKGKAKGKAK